MLVIEYYRYLIKQISFNPYLSKAGFFWLDASYHINKVIMISVICFKNKPQTRPFYSKPSKHRVSDCKFKTKIKSFQKTFSKISESKFCVPFILCFKWALAFRLFKQLPYEWTATYCISFSTNFSRPLKAAQLDRTQTRGAEFSLSSNATLGGCIKSGKCEFISKYVAGAGNDLSRLYHILKSALIHVFPPLLRKKFGLYKWDIKGHFRENFINRKVFFITLSDFILPKWAESNPKRSILIKIIIIL